MLNATQKVINEHRSAWEWQVQSKSEKGKFYNVSYNEKANKWSCDCFAGSLNKPCRHKRIVYNQLHGITKSEYETL